LLPIAPLDGFGVLFGVLPATLAYRLGWLGKYGPPILLVLVFSGSIIGFSLLSLILGPPTRELMRLVLGAAGLR
ncbi:MAG TPA: site-2 protease family protein, partial [Chloroflexota bacterium]|nr:site-2 protease family protein [Chloroflexota bacterium]